MTGIKDVSWQATGQNGAVAGGGKEAVRIGLQVLQNGGNAADAAAATLLALSVTDFRKFFCFGGEVPMLVYDSNRKVVEVLCGQGAAPALATRERVTGRRREKKGENDISSCAVPGVLDACLTALERFGTRSFADVAAPLLPLLERGEEDWHPRFAATISGLIDVEKAVGERRRGLRLVADYFYRGPIAREIDRWSRDNNGLIRYSDIARHATRIEEPVTVEYRGHTVCKCGPWSQGPALLQALKLLEAYDIGKMGQNRAATVHVLAEAIKLAMADRDVYYGDPLFVDVPLKRLLSEAYCRKRGELIDLRRASSVLRPGDPNGNKGELENYEPLWGYGGPEHDTTNCVVADRWGNMVAATPSGAGGGEAGGTGVMMGDRLDCFNVWENHPNCVEPGKRPRTTLTPTLVMKDGTAVLAMNIAGTDLQEQSSLQLLINHIDFGLAPAECIGPPRFFTRHFIGSYNQTAPEPGSLYLSAEMDSDVVSDLRDRGHKVELIDRPQSHDVLVCRDPKTGMIQAAGDPKTERHAAAF